MPDGCLRALWSKIGKNRWALFCEHMELQDTTGKLLSASEGYAQLDVGTNRPLFKLPHATCGYLVPDCFIKELWRCISECKVTVDVTTDTFWTPKLQRDGDRFLMDVAREVLDEKDLETLQECLRHQQVLSVADISRCDGHCLLPGIGDLDAPPRLSKHNWPRGPDRITPAH